MAKKKGAKKRRASTQLGGPLLKLRTLVRAVLKANGRDPRLYELEMERLFSYFSGMGHPALGCVEGLLRSELIDPQLDLDDERRDQLLELRDGPRPLRSKELKLFCINEEAMQHIRLQTEKRMSLGTTIMEAVIACEGLNIEHSHPFMDAARNMALHLLVGRTTMT